MILQQGFVHFRIQMRQDLVPCFACLVTPDGFTGRTALFKVSRWPELHIAIRERVLDYSTRDAARMFLSERPLESQFR